MATFKDPNQEIEAIGPNFEQAFGTDPVATKAVALSSTVLQKPMTSDEILQNIKVSPVLLSDFYSALPTLDVKSNHLFFVQDDDTTLKTVYAFQDQGKWRIVSPTSIQAGPYEPGLIIWTL